jgi:hypothetical protein
MKAQTPAEGILKTNDWGDAKCIKLFVIVDNADHEHNLWVEADETGV